MGAGQRSMVSELIQGRPGTNRHARGRVPIDATTFRQSSEADQGGHVELPSLEVGHQVGPAGNEHRARVRDCHLRRFLDGPWAKVLETRQAQHAYLPFHSSGTSALINGGNSKGGTAFGPTRLPLSFIAFSTLSGVIGISSMRTPTAL